MIHYFKVVLYKICMATQIPILPPRTMRRKSICQHLIVFFGDILTVKNVDSLIILNMAVLIFLKSKIIKKHDQDEKDIK